MSDEIHGTTAWEALAFQRDEHKVTEKEHTIFLDRDEERGVDLDSGRVVIGDLALPPAILPPALRLVDEEGREVVLEGGDGDDGK
ncbi:hypothetical protein [Streptomyces sp. ST2-7A]|uniref:hypothetical protein n=1 Tax=Streptomyces sp. ST2-7A TaxID=2907214 RepID=UPI001F228556|nr:hypothetical protein [Streptomyces sp. ST2-7A]MCE7083238.1 hypothetical protein [Streptomyces sp. ST2-7A]